MIRTLILVVAVFAGFLSAQDPAQVRKEIESQYSKLAQANSRRDLKAVLAMRTPDFHAIGPDGKVLDSATMAGYSKRFLEDNQPPIATDFRVIDLGVSADGTVAVAQTEQKVSRFRVEGGLRRKVETSAVQRETWIKGSQGWRLASVDDVRDQRRFVDGKRVDPSKPYDPNAPVFDPDAANVLASRMDVAAASAKAAATGLTAWKLRDANMFMQGIPQDLNVKKADGTAMTWQSLSEDQTKRMASTKHVDHLFVTIKVSTVKGDDAVVLSTQDLSRVARGNSGDVRIVTGVIHREIWKRTGGRWHMEKFTEENPVHTESDAKVTDPVEHYKVVLEVEDTK